MRTVSFLQGKNKANRYPLIDAVRGLCVTGMIFYHALFDITVLFGFDTEKIMGAVPMLLLRDVGAGLFIFLSGFCSRICSRPVRRFAVLFVCGAAVSLVTFFVAPDTPVLFGILTFMSVSGLILYCVGRLSLPDRLPQGTLCIVNALLFVLLLRMNYAYIGTYSHVWLYMPTELYRNYFTAFLGFPFNGFTSGDYFPLLPWLFIAFAGYFFFGFVAENEKVKRTFGIRIPVLSFLGRNSLVVYIVHQPIIYGVVWLIARMIMKK